MDTHSVSSSSTDPDRLEVDMSQAIEDVNSSSTNSISPPPDRINDWSNIYHSNNGFNAGMPALSGKYKTASKNCVAILIPFYR